MVENYTTDRLDFKRHGQGSFAADLRRADRWERCPVGTPEGRSALLSAVREHLAGTAQPS
jgi:hypothetical protein